MRNNPRKLFCGYLQTDSRVKVKRQKTHSQHNIKEQCQRTDYPTLRLNYKATIIKTMWFGERIDK